MRKFECDHTICSQESRHSCCEVVQIRHLRQYIVADDQVSLPTLRHKPFRETQAEELDEGGNILLARSLCHIGRGLDADYRNPQRKEMLQQIAVVARDLKNTTL